MAITSGGKAYFTNVDGGGTFYCQFNPKELKLEDTASWKPSDEQGKSKPLLTYEKGQPAVLSMDLVFDTTDTGGSVQGRIDALRAFLAATVTEKDEGGESKRPPHVDFHWNSFTFKGVVEKLSVSVLMFKADGTPMRAKVSITMKERSEGAGGGTGAGSAVTLSSANSIFKGAAVSATTVKAQPNQTLTQAAAANNTDFRTLAKANPQITDPMNVPAGTELVVPANNELANVLADRALAVTPSNTSPTGTLNPFGNSGEGGALGDLGNLIPSNNDDLSAAFNSLGDEFDAMVDNAQAQVNAAVDNAQERVNEAVDNAQERVNAAVDNAQAQANAAVDAAQERVNETVDNAQAQANAAVDAAQDKANAAVDEAQDVLGNPDFDFF